MFNEFSDEHPDLREDDETKNELHQRTDELSDQMWTMSEDRKKEAVDEREKIMTCGLVENEMSEVTTMAQ